MVDNPIHNLTPPTPTPDPVPPPIVYTPAQLAQQLLDQQNNMWDNIKAERDNRKLGGVLVNGKWINTDTYSRTQWIGMMMMGASVPAVQWKTMDGTFITVTQTLVQQVFQAIATSDIAIFTVAETHKAAMLASSTPLTYDFSGGWPATYVG